MVDLVIVVPHLGDGGVQRVVTTLANEWNRAGRRIAIVTLYREPTHYAVDPGVRVISLLDSAHAPLLLGTLEGLRVARERLRAWARAKAAPVFMLMRKPPNRAST